MTKKIKIKMSARLLKKNQRSLANEIKKARVMALLPYCAAGY
jgi:ribosomal protein S18